EYELGKRGVFVLSATEETYKFDMGTRMFKAFTLINNENEAVKIRQNVRRGQSHTAKQGKTNGGIAPLGYDINKEGKYIINEAEAEIVRKIFKMRSQGMTYSHMAKVLNEQHYKTKVGRAYTKNSFYEILCNPKYKGEFVYNRSAPVTEFGKKPNRHKYKSKEEIISLKGEIEAIVSEELWESVQPKHNQVKKKGKGKYLLSGLVTCPVCGGSYQSDIKKGNLYFRHVSANKTDKCRTLIHMDEVEKQVVRKVVSKIYSAKNIDYFLDNFGTISAAHTAESAEEVKTLKARINGYKHKLEICADNLTKVTDEETIVELEAKIREAKRAIAELTDKLNSVQENAPKKPTKDEVIQSKKKLAAFLLNPKNTAPAARIMNRTVDFVHIEKERIRIALRI
ncbi:MAG: recombinase family protein, partial [Clostridia bacterium]|nr:recombinase family protein [Clostridia bacterium]